MAVEKDTSAALDVAGELYDLRALALSARAVIDAHADCEEHANVGRILRLIADKADAVANVVRSAGAALNCGNGGAA